MARAKRRAKRAKMSRLEKVKERQFKKWMRMREKKVAMVKAYKEEEDGDGSEEPPA